MTSQNHRAVSSRPVSIKLGKEPKCQTITDRVQMSGIKPNNKGSVSLNGLQQSEYNQQSVAKPSGQRKSWSKNRTHHSAVMKDSDQNIESEILKD